MAVVHVRHTTNGYALVAVPNSLASKFSQEGLTLLRNEGAWMVQDHELPRIESWLRATGHLVVTETLRQRPDPLPFPDVTRAPRQPDEVARRGSANARQALAKARAREDDDPNDQPPPRDTP